MQIAFHTKYCQEPKALVRRGSYQNGQIALVVFAFDGEALATATVNLEAYGESPSPGNVIVYGDYSEHVGVQKALQDAGVVGPPIRKIDYGRGDAHAFECELLAKDLRSV